MIYGSQSFPPLQTLRAFLAVVDSGSFTRAASGLGLTQTAVSHQVAQLERWIGMPVFVRERSGIRLTAAGDALLPRVRMSLALLAEAVVDARRSQGKRRLTISTTPEFGTQWLVSRLDIFMREQSDLTVSISFEYRRADLAAGEADLAIWLGPGAPPLAAERLALEDEFVVSSPGLYAALPKRRALLAAPLLHYAGERHTVLDWRRWYSQIYGSEEEGGTEDLHHILDFDGGPSFQTFPEMLGACRSDKGFALVRTSLVADDLASDRLVRCFVESVSSDLHYHLVWHPQSRRIEDIETFRTWICSQLSG